LTGSGGAWLAFQIVPNGTNTAMHRFSVGFSDAWGTVFGNPRLVARYDIRVRVCAECGQRLPRAIPGAGRPLAYCSAACRQRAYRRRGGRASGTTGAERRRRARQDPPAG
jgi:hypothetical protein